VICFSNEVELGQTSSGCLSLFSQSDPAVCFNDLQTCFTDFSDWEHALENAVSRQASVQELINISEAVIHSPMMVYDPALKLLAWTKKHDRLDDAIFQKEIQNGYLDLESFRYFEQARAFEQMNTRGSASLEADEYHSHADYQRSINVGNQLAVYAILLHASGVPRSYEKILFDIVCDAIRQLLENQHTTFLRDRSVTDFFLMELLDNPNTDPDVIRERIQYHDLDYNGCYAVIQIRSDIRKRSAEQFFLQQLRRDMINCRIFLYHESITILYMLPPSVIRSSCSYLKPRLLQITRDFPNSKMMIGISKPFLTIGDFAEAWLQTEQTLDYCSSAGDTVPGPLFFYEDHWIRILLSQGGYRNRSFFFCEPIVVELINENTKKSMQQLTILREYLNSDRNYTNVAKKLSMHRNNVIYHIQKIEEEHGLDLNDPQTRLKLLLSFELFASSLSVRYNSEQR